jgi:Tol biopolymer transport system component
VIRVVRLGAGEENAFPSSSDEMGAFSPDGLSIAHPSIRRENNSDVYQLWIQSLDQPESNLLLESAREIADVVWSSNGRWIAFEAWHDRVKITGDVKLVLFNMETREMQDIPCCDTYGFMDLQWNPTGDQLLVRLTEAYPSSDTRIMIYNVETGKSEVVVENGTNARWIP